MNAEIDQLERIAHRMDTLFRVPFLGVRVGLDSILGLVPGVGDALTLAPGAYIIHRAHRMGAPRHLVGRMIFNSGMDAVIGAIPLVGDIFDLGFKSNRRNVALLRSHLERKGAALSDDPQLSDLDRAA